VLRGSTLTGAGSIAAVAQMSTQAIGVVEHGMTVSTHESFGGIVALIE
jgi:hypothetical protein